jgi:hypothetical protein
MLPLALMLLLNVDPPAADAPDEDAPTFIVSLGVLAGAQTFELSATAPTDKTFSFITGARAGLYVRLLQHIGVMPSLNFRFDAKSFRTEWSSQMNLVSSLGQFLVIAGAGYGLTALPAVTPTSFFEVRAGLGLIIWSVFVSVDAEMRFRTFDNGRALAVTVTASWELPVKR